MVGTEMLYFAVGSLGLDGGIAVTASHNPKEYTGMKIVRRGALPVGGDSGLMDIRRRAEAASAEPAPASGRSRRRTSTRAGRRKSCPSSLPTAVAPPTGGDRRRERDGRGNASAGARAAARGRGACYFEPDGTFPNHEPNPLLPENRDFIVAKVLEEDADLGVAFDGDADRCFFVDDTGEFVPGDFVTALLAEAVLANEPGATIIYDVRASWAVRTWSRQPVVARSSTASATPSSSTGCARRMRPLPARYPATTTSVTIFQADSGVVPMLLMLELVSRKGQRLSEILAHSASGTSSPASSTRPWPTSR